MPNINSNERAESFRHFATCFRKATQNISQVYMHLPIAGSPLPVYRERVYCYELYHQLRLSWDDYGGYSLGGEVDKTHHPIMRDPGLERAKPDLLVHKPGDMDGNLVVIEVKPVVAKKTGIEKDLRTLAAFLHHGRYHKAIYLVYGDKPGALGTFRRAAGTLQKRDAECRNELDKIILYWHRSAGSQAEQADWDAD